MRILSRFKIITCIALGSAVACPCSTALALPANGNGHYTQILCADPTTGDGVGISGMPEGLSNPSNAVTWQVATSQVNCSAGPMTTSRGVPMSVGQGNTYAQGTWTALLYQAPPHATISGGTIYRAEFADGAFNGYMGIIQQGGDYTTLYSTPANNADAGDWFAGGIAARGTYAAPFAHGNQVNLVISPDGGHWDVNATCDPNGNNNSSCTLVTKQWEYRIFGGVISLASDNDPQASNITGPIATDSSLRGSESVTFSATDEGPGLAYVKLLVDGSSVQSQTIDTNSGHCVPVAGEDAYTWAYQVPCKTSVGGRTYGLNTALVHDGSHHIQVVIEDAAGNRSIVVDRTVTTNNAPAASGNPTVTGTAQLGAVLTGSNATFAVPAGAEPLSAVSAQWLRCTSNSVPASCQPINGATGSTYTTTSDDLRHLIVYQNTASDADGQSVVYSAPTLEIADPNAGAGNAGGPGGNGTGGPGGNGTGGPGGNITVTLPGANQGSVLLGTRTPWKLSLRVTPKRVRRGTHIKLIGRVSSSPRPSEGKLVYLQARGVVARHGRHRRHVGKWVTFQAFRAKTNGSFASSYRFKLGGRHTYQFRAVAPAEGQYRNSTGTSRVIAVREH